MSELNLYQRIQAVSNEIRNIDKNMTVGSGSYSYKAVSDIDVVLVVKEAESAHGIVSIPIKQELVETQVLRTQRDRGGEAINYVDIVKMTLRIVNVDKPEEFIDIESFGRGLDSGDKGFGKASTYARKYALLNAYKIATGEDPDKDKSKEQIAIPVDPIKDEVVAYSLKNEEYMSKLLSYFNLGSIDEMSKSQINTVYGDLKKKGLL